VAQEQLNLQLVAQTPLDDGRVAAVRDGVARGWNENRIVPSLFRRAGTPVQVIEQSDTSEVIRSAVRIDRTLLQPNEVLGTGDMGDSIGAGLAMLEFGMLAGELRKVVAAVDVQAAPRDALASLIDELEAANVHPSVIIVPVDWRLERALELRDITRAAPTLGDWYGVPPGAATWYRGRFANVMVFAHPGMPKGQLLIADLNRIGIWRDVIPPGESSPMFELTEQPPKAGATTPPFVVVTVEQAYTFSLADPAAGRRVTYQLTESE
jgi:hypothetical protein